MPRRKARQGLTICFHDGDEPTHIEGLYSVIILDDMIHICADNINLGLPLSRIEHLEWHPDETGKTKT